MGRSPVCPPEAYSLPLSLQGEGADAVASHIHPPAKMVRRQRGTGGRGTNTTMAFPLKDVRYTTRRQRGEDDDSGVAETRALYPRLCRDRSILPKIAIAVEYFDSLVGKERQDFDAEVLVQFFGDHKLARCIVGALASSYRYRSPQFAEVATRTALRRLLRAGVDSPKTLRAHLYQRLNGESDGFMTQAERDPLYGSIEGSFALRPGQAERLLYLDAEEHAVLTRIGGKPEAVDIAAQYNFGVLETLLRHAESIELTLCDGGTVMAGAAATVRALCAASDVDAHVDTIGSASGAGTLRLRLVGRQDALGGWARHGRRVARVVVQLLERARPAVVEGAAALSLRERRVTLRLTPELLDALDGGSAPGAGWDDLPGWDVAAVAAGLAAARGGRGGPAPSPAGAAPGEAAPAGALLAATSNATTPKGATKGAPRRREGTLASESQPGWGLRRMPEAQAWAAGMIVPDVRLVRGAQGVRLCAVRSVRHGARLAAIAPGAVSGEPLLYVGHPLAVEPLAAAGQRVVATPTFDLRPVWDALPVS